MKKIDKLLRKKVLKHQIVSSGYAFACFNSFSAIYNLKQAFDPKKKFGLFR